MHFSAATDIPPFVLDKIRQIPVGKGMGGVAVEKKQPVTTCNLQTDDAGGIIRQGARATGAQGAVAVADDDRGRSSGCARCGHQRAARLSLAPRSTRFWPWRARSEARCGAGVKAIRRCAPRVPEKSKRTPTPAETKLPTAPPIETARGCSSLAFAKIGELGGDGRVRSPRSG